MILVSRGDFALATQDAFEFIPELLEPPLHQTAVDFELLLAGARADAHRLPPVT